MADRLDLEQLRKSLASGLMYPGPMQDAASFLLSLVDEGGRLAVEAPCEHGKLEEHYLCCDSDMRLHDPDNFSCVCPGGSRRVVWPPKEGEQEAVSHG